MSEETQAPKDSDKTETTDGPAAKSSADAKPAARKKTTARKTTARKATTKTAASKTAASKSTASKSSTAKKPSTRRKPAAKPAANAAAEDAAPAPKAEAAPSQEQDAPSTEGVRAWSSDKSDDHQSESDAARKAQEKLDELKGRDWADIAARALGMLVYGFVGYVVLFAGLLLSFLHFLLMIFNGTPHTGISRAIRVVGLYLGEIFDYLSCRTDAMPFPLGKELPKADD